MSALWLIGIALTVGAVVQIFNAVHAVFEARHRLKSIDNFAAAQQALVETQSAMVQLSKSKEDLELRHVRASEALAEAAGGKIKPEIAIAEIKQILGEPPKDEDEDKDVEGFDEEEPGAS